MVNYPDIAAVRVTAVTEAGEEIAVATLLRDDMNEFRWREALARSSLAQRDGTQNPRLVERLITFGEDHTDFRYGELAN
jgi:deferrochelatase/peroxidase EfeB